MTSFRTGSAVSRAEETELFEVGRRPPLIRYVQNIWERRAFALQMPFEEVRSQHLNTALGNLWHVLNPMLLTLTYYLIFGLLLRIDRGQENFIAFLTIGVFAFHYTQRSVTAGARSITRNRSLIRSVYFPRAILPLSAVVSQTMALIPAMGVVLLVSVITGETPGAGWVMLLPVLTCQAFLNLGLALLIAPLAARYRDTEQMLRYVFRLLFYGSGVLFPVTRWVAEDSLRRTVFEWNPIYAIITMLRGAILGTEVAQTLLVSASIWTVVLLAAGLWYFLRGEQEYGNA